MLQGQGHPRKMDKSTILQRTINFLQKQKGQRRRGAGAIGFFFLTFSPQIKKKIGFLLAFQFLHMRFSFAYHNVYPFRTEKKR